MIDDLAKAIFGSRARRQIVPEWGSMDWSK